MDQQQQRKKENGGYLYKNAKKSEKQPDWRGKINIGGKEWLISGWTRSQNGEEMISLALTDPATLPQRPQGSGAPATAAGPFAKNQGAKAPTPSAAPAAFNPSGAGAGSPSQDDLEDLDSLFQGFDGNN